jgi:signal transduction histidine kinase
MALSWTRFGLSSRLLLLTVIFVMLAEVMIFVPSIANFRNSWLNDRLAAARVAALVLEAAPDDALPEGLVKDLLISAGAESIALRIKGTRRLLAVTETPPPVSVMTDMRANTIINSIRQSFDTLMIGGDRRLALVGEAAMGGDFVEITLNERPLRDAMLRFAWNILILSLFISAVTAALVFLTLRRLIVGPVMKLTGNITHFAKKPEDQTRLIRPSGRTDELGVAEEAVAGMQQALSKQLKQKEHLAALGLAVSKINHDLRNMLASAQLVSDRLGEVRDPTVQRLAPKLIQTLDRAIAFCQSTLAYGRAEERPPVPTEVPLRELLEEVQGLLGLNEKSTIKWNNSVPLHFVMTADPEHMLRILLNLCRNAVHAMEANAPQVNNGHSLTLEAHRNDTGWTIDISDTGPGVPAHIRDKLFEAFHGSSRPGGTGLGLSIAADLARAQGGDIQLVESSSGARFRITLPAPVSG